jgi:hypothetical protein
MFKADLTNNLPVKFNLSVGNVVGVALCCLCSEQLVYATVYFIRSKPGIKKQKAILWPGALTLIVSQFKHNIFIFWAYNVRTYWTIVVHAFSEHWLTQFTKALIIHVFKSEFWIYFVTCYVNNIFPLLYEGAKFGLSNQENYVHSDAIQVSCLLLGCHRNTSFS